MKITITLSVSDVQRSISKRGTYANHEQFKAAVNDELKRIFIRKGIRFYDKPGLYPLPHSTLSSHQIGADRIITISQEPDND